MNALAKPLSIGPLTLDFPVVQAALSGYSDGAMRLIARRLGAPYSLCEVMLDRLVNQGGKRARRMMQIADEEHPVGGQLMGSDPREFARAASVLVEAGVDVVDINFGCPVPKVLGRCRGGFLLGEPVTALEIVGRVRDAVPPQVPVTVKMRRGVDDTPASRDKFFQILDGAVDCGVAAVTVHARTVQQRYVGASRWAFLREVKQHVGAAVKILGSGDLFSAEDCLRMMEQTGIDGLTAARGAIGNPWIFAQCRALAGGRPPQLPSLFEQRDVIAEHYRLAEAFYGPALACRQMRKFGIKYAKLHPEYPAVRQAFVEVRQTADWQQVLHRWYCEDLPGRAPAPDDTDSDRCDAAA